MPRKTRKQQFAALEDDSVRAVIPSKILPLIEQLVFEKFVEIEAALTLRLALLEGHVEELETRLEKLSPEPRVFDPSKVDWDEEEPAEDPPEDPWKDPDEDRDDEIPF